MPSIQSTLADRVCRFCLQLECKEGAPEDFVQPCTCRGTLLSVHMDCLVRHFLVRGEWQNFTCPTCKHSYEGRALQRLACLSGLKMIREHGEHSLAVAHSLVVLSDAENSLGNASSCKDLLECSLSIQERHFGKDHVKTAATIGSLASAHGKLGSMHVERQLLERCLSIKENHFGSGHIYTSVTLNNLSAVYRQLGDVILARELAERSVAINQAHYGQGHWKTASALVNLAAVLGDLGEISRCRSLLEGCLTLEVQHFGKFHIETASTLNNLALACGQAGDIQQMRSLLERSLTIKDRQYGSGHVESCLTLANLSLTCGVTDDEGHARDYGDRALAACGVADSHVRGVVFLSVAAVHCALSETEEADHFASQALEMLDEVSWESEKARTSRIWSVSGRSDLAQWMRVNGQPKEAGK